MLNIVKDTNFDTSCVLEKGGSFQMESEKCQADAVLKASSYWNTQEAKSALQVVCLFLLWES